MSGELQELRIKSGEWRVKKREAKKNTQPRENYFCTQK